MGYWPWWMGGLLLAGVALVHWFLLQRQIAVSGRYTALVNRLRFGRPDDSVEQVSHEELIQAMRAMTAAEFGDARAFADLEDSDQFGAQASDDPSTEREPPLVRQRQSLSLHILFLTGLLVGGLLASATSGEVRADLSLQSDAFSVMFGGGAWGWLALVAGGVLVGFGTRMASGCTSGHGLCGVSRLQKGSLLATLCFFGTGVIVSLVLGAMA